MQDSVGITDEQADSVTDELIRRFGSLESELDKANSVIAATEKTIEERGCFEINCTLPLPERLDSLIVDQRSAAHWKAERDIMANRVAELEAALRPFSEINSPQWVLHENCRRAEALLRKGLE